jgi:hypothetical protein
MNIPTVFSALLLFLAKTSKMAIAQEFSNNEEVSSETFFGVTGGTETDGPSRTDTDRDGWTVPAKIIREETTSALSSVSPGGGQGRVFFGEDIDGCNTGDIPNAASARDEFFSFLDPDIFTETFENVNGVVAPLDLAFGGNLYAILTQGSMRSSALGGRCPISGTKYWRTNTGTPGNFGIMALVFTEPVAILWDGFW